MACFWLADAGPVFRSLDGWLRRRLRQMRWKEWKTIAAKRHNPADTRPGKCPQFSGKKDRRVTVYYF